MLISFRRLKHIIGRRHNSCAIQWNKDLIFICTFDPFKAGLSKYTFRNICEEDSGVQLGDETEKIFFNATGNHEGLTEAQKQFLNYVAGKGAGDDFTRQLDERVREIKMDQKKKVDYMTWKQEIIEQREDAKAEGRAEGRVEGKAEGKAEISKMNSWLSSNGRMDELIKSFTDKVLQSRLMEEYYQHTNQVSLV